MTALSTPSPLRGRSAKGDLESLVAAAAQRRVSVRHEDRWPVYLVNGNEAPDARPLLVPLLEAGRLVVADPDAAESLILPA